MLRLKSRPWSESRRRGYHRDHPIQQSQHLVYISKVNGLPLWLLQVLFDPDSQSSAALWGGGVRLTFLYHLYIVLPIEYPPWYWSFVVIVVVCICCSRVWIFRYNHLTYHPWMNGTIVIIPLQNNWANDCPRLNIPELNLERTVFS